MNLREKDGEEIPMARCMEDGHVAISLKGKKLEGGFGLVRTGKGDGARWLLIKMKDDKADARRNPVNTQPKSALTARTLKEIERDERV